MRGWRYLASVFLLMVWTTSASHAQSSHLTLQIIDGRVSLLAHNISLRAVLAEWERISGARIVNADQLDERTPMTLQLNDVTEQEALATLLRDVPGYMIARGVETGSIDRILILAKSAALPPPAAAVQSVPTSAAADTPFVDVALEASGDAGVGIPTRERADPSVPDEVSLGAAPGAPPARAAVRINSSDSISNLVEGANAATLVPVELRPATPIFRPAPAPGTRPGEITTGGPPPGFEDPVVTNPAAHQQPTNVPTAPTSR